MAATLPKLVAFAVLIAACGGGSTAGTTTPSNSPPDQPVPDLVASCGAVVFADPARPEPPSTALDDDAASAIEQAHTLIGAEAGFFDTYEWFLADRTDTSLVLFGSPLAPQPAGAPQYASATFSREGETWQPEGWGQCRVEIDAPGFGSARWVLDPAIEPHPEATELNILINERDCASGEPPIGREILPVVAADADHVTVTVLVEPVAGDAACPENPWHPVTVDLGEPLGERAVLDGSQSPPLERVWPPTATSLDSLGREG